MIPGYSHAFCVTSPEMQTRNRTCIWEECSVTWLLAMGGVIAWGHALSVAGMGGVIAWGHALSVAGMGGVIAWGHALSVAGMGGVIACGCSWECPALTMALNMGHERAWTPNSAGVFQLVVQKSDEDSRMCRDFN